MHPSKRSILRSVYTVEWQKMYLLAAYIHKDFSQVKNTLPEQYRSHRK